jgi:aspartate aminotransferase
LLFNLTLADNVPTDTTALKWKPIMFDTLQALTPDPILGLMAAYQSDPNPHKVDLGVGVYKDVAGNTPVLASVKAAEAVLLQQQDSKAYIGPAGCAEFTRLLQVLLLGPSHAVLAASRATAVATPGGCGALRAGAELLVRARPEAKIWVSDPTWANHTPLLGSAGLEMVEYPYYSYDSKDIRFDAMMASLQQAKAGDVLLLHGCCHNPCGADLSLEQWRQVTELVLQRGLLPFVDVAYQGFGEGIDEDVQGLRLMADSVPEMLVASSCSKNFGLYRERTGSLTVIAQTAAQASIAQSQVCNAVRALWSMPPDHGAAVVATILSDIQLRAQWQGEVADMRNRINALRAQLVTRLAAAGAGDFDFIASEHGMFSFLGVTPVQVAALRQQFSIYMVDSSRINVAGINPANIDYVCQAVANVRR